MEQYTGFAQVYDLFMSDIPYDEWTDAVVRILKEHGIQDGLVLELGCGTGNITRRLKTAGYDMIGVDSSEEMLDIAMRKDSKDILYLNQDMREFELYGTVRAIVALCDSMNYILSEEDMLTVFRLVNNYLDPSGIFMFDMKTEYLYSEELGESCFTENREEGSLIWENYYDEEEHINQYDITIYYKHAESDLYERFEETHVQRAYSEATIKRLITESGLEYIGAFSAFDGKKPGKCCERVYYLARECTKTAE